MAFGIRRTIDRLRRAVAHGEPGPDAEIAPDDAGPEVPEDEREDPIEMAERGIAFRDAEDYEVAEPVFRELIAAWPDLPYGWQELGVLQARRGEAREAADCFRAAVRLNGADLLFRIYCATHLTFMGETTEADEVLASYEPHSDEERDQVAALRDAVRFVALWPEARALDLSRGIEEGGGYILGNAVETRALEAASAGQGFSVIRVGDGEGAWLKLGPEDEALFPHLYAWNRREFLRLWFNDDALHEDARFHALSPLLAEAMDGASVLGIPYSLRIVHEYNVGSTRGVPSSVNALRWMAERMAARPRLFCSQDVHIELQYGGSFRRILGAGHPVGLISCHAGLPALVEARTGARIVQFHPIPEEKGFSDVLGIRIEAERHFPTAFERVMAALRAGSRRGEIWLVSAGFLGKLYCEAIRAGGGVALDIGSITDGWFGKVTRPTLQEIERFAL